MHMEKARALPPRDATIPCSIAIITRGEGLGPALEALHDFAEIIVCHGNPSQENLDLAKSFGATLVKQYDTDEPNLTCVTDKAAVRERAMQASTLPWRFFMDRDDRLSPETVEEIRAITTDPHPAHLVWRMPSRVFIAGREIKHYATYPAYQTRLVHEGVGAHFRGHVHERLEFDAHKFSVGTMRSSYDFHWSAERVKNYWNYSYTYALRELEASSFSTFSSFLYWGVYRRSRTILGYVFWRLPAMYLRHGFRDSMPLSIELQTVAYHMVLLFGSVARYVKTRSWWIWAAEMLRGSRPRTVRRMLAARTAEIYGRTLVYGSAGEWSTYERYLQKRRWHRVTVAHDQCELPKHYFDTIIVLDTNPHMKSILPEALRPTGKLYHL